MGVRPPDKKIAGRTGATRPWLHSSPPENRTTGVYETKRQAAERETCLSCPAPDCIAALCPLERKIIGRSDKNLSRGIYKRSAPESFRYYGRVETIPELQERYKVGKTIIQRWRRETGIVPEKG